MSQNKLDDFLSFFLLSFLKPLLKDIKKHQLKNGSNAVLVIMFSSSPNIQNIHLFIVPPLSTQVAAVYY